MGFFSWRCCVCNGSIPNLHSIRADDSACVLVTPDKTYHEPAYAGFGDFDGIDVYWLLGSGDRDVGIKLSTHPLLEPPFDIKVLHKRCFKQHQYSDLQASEDCPEQGFFY